MAVEQFKFFFLFLYELYRGGGVKEYCSILENVAMSLLFMNERRSVSAHYECFLDAGSAQSFPLCVYVRLLLGGLKETEAGGEMRSCYTAHVHMEDSASQTASVLLSQRTTFK